MYVDDLTRDEAQKYADTLRGMITRVGFPGLYMLDLRDVEARIRDIDSMGGAEILDDSEDTREGNTEWPD
ncbi:hypothetical protein FDH96_gp120 [Mycobacterium phage Rey]|uniref:Uncharacterized protein n=1 Tax=Mycobacterium phage Rey TaxID=1034115 RepID=G1D5J9_9CAUD|nr:hypothetical protein FDH96_gp120 [Mycobacterium phage Rey]AEK10047.1 hypothetical protein PBI_REY_159 [Mycobacterium phage Rey]